ncbi:MAG TPA: HipA domain-containing protein [Burkholderiaceae bacterium]
MNGERVGTWTRLRSGSDRLSYDHRWMASEHGRPLSLSLPFTASGEVRGRHVGDYFDNLLPDDDTLRARIRRRFALPDADAMTLLRAIGRDCVGALQLLPPAAAPDATNVLSCEPLDDDGVARLLAAATNDDPARGEEHADEFRISLAGAQEKTALLRVGETWCRPSGATPTTHIVKLPIGLVGGYGPDGPLDFSLSVENEWLCLKLLEAFGLPTANASIHRFGEHRALVVERFDRRWTPDGRWIVRLPQEDFCQATGTSWRDKYERDGGPGIDRCLALLSGSDRADADKTVFCLCQLAFWLLAAPDGHAKNFSLFIGRGGRYRATPIYDVMSIWPLIGRGEHLETSHRKARLAMALKGRNAHRELRGILPRHWKALADAAGVPGLFDAMLGLLSTVPSRLAWVEAQLPHDFPPRLWQVIRDGVSFQAGRFWQLHDEDPVAT